MKIILTANEVAELIAQHISNKGIELNTAQIKCEDVVIDLDAKPSKPTKKDKLKEKKEMTDSTQTQVASEVQTSENTTQCVEEKSDDAEFFDSEPNHNSTDELDDDSLFD